jgi:hypothetical protein
VVAGEVAQDIGRDGLQRAKQWLDLTTRVKEIWSYDHRLFAGLLCFSWPHASRTEFSFDLGGTFRGDQLAGQSFLAEVKNYQCESDLPEHFRNFLAKCYVALGTRPEICDNFLWISWSPFQAQRWNRHATKESVRAALLHKDNRKRVFGVDNEADALLELDSEYVAQVASRIWLITLSVQQEKLVLTEGHRLAMAEIFTREERTL